MLLRLIAENITSFNEAVEFNTFPSSKSHSHENHKIKCGHATALRMSAIYGANGAGKSNLIKVLSTLQGLVMSGTLGDMNIGTDLTFRFDPICADQPSGIAIEFHQNGNTLNDGQTVLVEKTKDIKVFSREDSRISVKGDFFVKGLNESFIDALDRLVRPDMLLLTFLGKYYPNEIPVVADAYRWFGETLNIVQPGATTGIVPFLFDSDTAFADTVNSIMPELNTGIEKLKVNKELVQEEEIKGNKVLLGLVNLAKQHPGKPQIVVGHYGNDVSNIVAEDGAIYMKTLLAVHKDTDGTEVEMPLRYESDGTCRLTEYVPLLFAIMQ